MKNTILKTALVCGLISPFAAAAEPGFYITGGLGSGWLQSDLPQFAINGGAGYNFSDYFALEGLYQHYFSTADSAQSRLMSYRAEYSTDILQGFAVLKAPLTPYARLFIKGGVGYAWVNGDVELNHAGMPFFPTRFSFNSGDLSFGYGGGGEIDLNEKVTFGIQYLGASTNIDSVNTGNAVYANLTWRI